MDIGDRQPRDGRALPRQTACNRHCQHRYKPQRDENDRGGNDKDCRERPIVSKNYRQRRERRGEQRRHDHITASRPSPLGGDLVAKQHGHRNIVRAAKRPQRKGQRRQQAVHDRQHQCRRMQCGRDGKRNDTAEYPDCQERQRRAKAGADKGCEQRDQYDLRAINGKDIGAGRAQRFHRCDDVALAREMACHGIRYANAADKKRGQGDEREELTEALDIAFQLRRRLVARADVPAGIRELGLGLDLGRHDGEIA